MKRHLLNIHSSSEFKCEKCEEIFSCQKTLAIHLHDKITTEELSHGKLEGFVGVICTECKALFTQMRLFKAHFVSFHKNQKAPTYQRVFQTKI
jgi:hypothetical protein